MANGAFGGEGVGSDYAEAFFQQAAVIGVGNVGERLIGLQTQAELFGDVEGKGGLGAAACLIGCIAVRECETIVVDHEGEGVVVCLVVADLEESGVGGLFAGFESESEARVAGDPSDDAVPASEDDDEVSLGCFDGVGVIGSDEHVARFG